MKTGSRTPRGFSLVEVVLALGVASFCLVILVALVPVGLQRYQKADGQSSMVNLATMVASDLDATTNGIGAAAVPSPRFSFSIPAPTPTAGGSTPPPQTVYVDASGVASGNKPGAAPNAASIYRISLFFYPPVSPLKAATTARILITAPAWADPAPQNAPTNYANIFETTVSLNRN
jgi:Tfp pilus assembly protein PilW